ncbi:hypothetical protein AUTU_23430 [Aureibacter tunicatorum]|nr:hypothetical protein AUTU_23430 [Aureibacter tunicatorum]
MLYRLEKGSWLATDHMLSNFDTKKDSLGGYLSYENEKGKICTIFYSRFDQNNILIKYVFDDIIQSDNFKIEEVSQMATSHEKSLITMREDAVERVYTNEDEYYSFYENTAMNFIPLISNEGQRVFVLTGPQVSGVVLLGNDYLLHYDEKSKFINKEKIHNSILSFPYEQDENGNTIETTSHSHVNSEYISSTDICTLLLYKDYLSWDQHTVLSKNMVSIFDLKNESLATMKMKAWKKLLDTEK